jgi:hypothetical protein
VEGKKMIARKRSVLFIVCFLGVLLFGVSGSTAIAVTFYVDYANGSDSNDGTSTSTPWEHCPGDPNATDNAASCSPAAGDVIYFKGGVTYTGSISIKTSGSSGNQIVYDGTPSGWGTGRAVLSGSFNFNNKGYITIRNFEITGFGYAGIYQTVSKTLCTSRIIDNNIVHDSGLAYAGIFLSSNSESTISNNRVYNIHKGTSGGRGILLLGSSLGRTSGNTISGNTVYDTDGTNILVMSQISPLVTGNKAYGTAAGHSNGITVYYCNDPTISHNIVWTGARSSYTIEGIDGTGTGCNIFNNVGDGLDTFGYVFACWNGEAPGNSGTLRLINNTFIRSSSNHAALVKPSKYPFPTIIMINNIIDGPSSGATIHSYNCFTANPTPETGGITETNLNNLFVDYANHDYRLKSNATCKDRGTDVSSYGVRVRKDIVGTFRPQGSGWDMGAYEGSSGLASPPAPPGGVRTVP